MEVIMLSYNLRGPVVELNSFGLKPFLYATDVDERQFHFCHTRAIWPFGHQSWLCYVNITYLEEADSDSGPKESPTKGSRRREDQQPQDALIPSILCSPPQCSAVLRALIRRCVMRGCVLRFNRPAESWERVIATPCS